MWLFSKPERGDKNVTVLLLEFARFALFVTILGLYEGITAKSYHGDNDPQVSRVLSLYGQYSMYVCIPTRKKKEKGKKRNSSVVS